MDETTRTSADDVVTAATMGRRAFFGRTLLALGGAGALIGLTGCPGGDGDDDGDDEGDDD